MMAPFIDDAILNYIILFILLEIFEVNTQRAQTMMGMLARMNRYYSRNIFLFLLMHPTFYFLLAFMTLCDYSLLSVTIVLLKGGDILMKIYLLEQVFKKREVTQEMMLVLLAPLHFLVPFLGILVYPPLIYLALLS